MSESKGKSIMSLYKKQFTTILALILFEIGDMLLLIILEFNRNTKNISINLFYLTSGFGVLILALLLFFLLKNMGKVFNNFKSLILIVEDLNKNIPFKQVLRLIFDSFSEYIPYTHIGVALIEDEGRTIKASYAVSGDLNSELPKKLIGYKTSINRTSLGKILDSREPRIINDLDKYLIGKKVNDYNKLLLENGIKSSITFPLINKHVPIGIIFFSSNQKNVYKKEHVEFLKILANSITLSLEEDILIDDMIVSSTLALATLTEERDNDTGKHLDRMKKYSKQIAELLSKEDKYKDIIDIDYINDIERFSPLHDIGKVAIRDEILLKPAKLTKEEFDIMKTHTIYGGKVLRLADENIAKIGHGIFKMGIEIAEGHHERWDGTGYPKGIKGESIPLSARIVAIADVLDALTSKRPYKKPYSFEDSINIIYKESGNHFDPNIVEVLRKNLDSIKRTFYTNSAEC